MASIEQALRGVFEDERRAATTPDALLRSVNARTARRRTGRLAGASLGALAAVGLAATAAVSLGHVAPPVAPPTVPPDSVLGVVTLPFDAAPVDGPWAGEVGADFVVPGIRCGAPAPKVSTSQEGVVWDVAKRTDDSWVQPVYTTLRYTQGGKLSASVSQMGFVVVQNGIVVGWTAPTYQGSSSSYQFLDGEGEAIADGFMGWGTYCGSDGATYGDFPDGAYDVYPVISVSASPEDAARAYLQFKGYDVPVDEPAGLAAFVPGSWDCSPGGWAHALESGEPLVGARSSALCTDDLPDVTVDRARGTITLPYTSRFYTRTVEATLVGPSSSYTLPNPNVTTDGFNVWFPDPVEQAASLKCGTLVGSDVASNWPNASTTLDAAAIDPAASDTLASGASARLALLPRIYSQPGTVSYPEGLTVWLIGHPDADSSAAAQAPPGAVTLSSYAVVGTATATISNGSPVGLDRYAGVSRTAITLGDVVWCDGGTPPTITDIVVSGSEYFATGDYRSITQILDVWSLRTDAWSAIGGGL